MCNIVRQAKDGEDAEHGVAGCGRQGHGRAGKAYLVLRGGAEAFVLRDDQIVAHGGLSVEELVVPFIKINFTRAAS